MKKTFEIYVHGDDEQMWDLATELGLKEGTDAHGMFSHAADEFKLAGEVDLDTGLVTWTALDNRTILRLE